MFSLRTILTKLRDKRRLIGNREKEAAREIIGASQDDFYRAPKRYYELDTLPYNAKPKTSREAEQGTNCPTCGGTGKVLATYNGYNRGTIGSTHETCWDCNGSGKK